MTACTPATPATPAESSTPTPSEAPTPAVSGPPPIAEPVTPAPPTRRPVTAADNAAHTAYKAAMQEGRTQTRAKALPQAIAAFDRALVQRPGDARALAERGYARLLARDLEGARVDLELARQRTQDPARLGAIWFNVGLVAEAAGNPEGARRAFALSNELRPGKAAAARLGAAPVCTAEIDRAPKPALAFTSWPRLFDHLRADTDEPALTTDAAVQKELRFDPKRDADNLWALDFFNALSVGSNSGVTHLVGRAPGGELLLFGELLASDSGDCQPQSMLNVTPIGGLLHARHVALQVSSELVPIDPNDPANVPCDQDGPIPASCEFDCRPVALDVDDYIIDLAGKQQRLRIRRTTNKLTRADLRDVEEALAIDIKVSPQAITLSGGGCEATLPLATPGP